MGKQVQERGNGNGGYAYNVVAEWTSESGTLYYWVNPEGENQIYTDYASGYEAYSPKPVKGQKWEGNMFQVPVTVEDTTDEYVVFRHTNGDLNVRTFETFTATYRPVQEG